MIRSASRLIAIPLRQTPQTSVVDRLEFEKLAGVKEDALSMIVRDFGTVYVTAITRDGCSGCEEQKPLFEDLALKVSKEHPGKATFSNIHIRYEEGDLHQSEEAKRMFSHGSYPTYMVHVKSRHGPLEHYRAAYPSMEELEKQVGSAFELAEFYAKHAETIA